MTDEPGFRTETMATVEPHEIDVQPGQECPVCKRRKPYPKTEASPPSKRMGYWTPADEYDAHEDVLRETAKYLGVHEQPFWEFKTAALALALVLQDESLRGYGQRSAA